MGLNFFSSKTPLSFFLSSNGKSFAVSQAQRPEIPFRTLHALPTSWRLSIAKMSSVLCLFFCCDLTECSSDNKSRRLSYPAFKGCSSASWSWTFWARTLVSTFALFKSLSAFFRRFFHISEVQRETFPTWKKLRTSLNVITASFWRGWSNGCLGSNQWDWWWYRLLCSCDIQINFPGNLPRDTGIGLLRRWGRRSCKTIGLRGKSRVPPPPSQRGRVRGHGRDHAVRRKTDCPGDLVKSLWLKRLRILWNGRAERNNAENWASRGGSKWTMDFIKWMSHFILWLETIVLAQKPAETYRNDLKSRVLSWLTV